MKFKTLGALCKKNGTFCLYDDISPEGELGTQWLGDGHAIYPLQGLPYLDGESLFTVLDITDKQQEKISFRKEVLPTSVNFKDTDENERIIDDEKLSLSVDGRVLKPLQTRGGVVFIDAAYLAPLADVSDMMELYERVTPNGMTYIAAKTGLLLAGVILPLNIIRKEFVQQMETLLQQCRVALSEKERRKAEQEADTAEQTTFE